MDIAALIFWVLTAIGGFTMLGIWVSRGGARTGGSRLPVPVIFGHFVLAVIGLVLWIIYIFTEATALAWIAFALLLLVALLGITMLVRWISVRSAGAGAGATAPAETHFPVAVVIAHGVLAVITVVLVVLGAIGVGGS